MRCKSLHAREHSFFGDRYHGIESIVGGNEFLRIGQKLLTLDIAGKTVNKTFINTLNANRLAPIAHASLIPLDKNHRGRRQDVSP